MSWDGTNHKREDLFRIQVCGQHIHGKKKLSKNLSEEKKFLRGKNQLKLTSQVLLSIKTVDK